MKDTLKKIEKISMWNNSLEVIMQKLGTRPEGLSTIEAKKLLIEQRTNTLKQFKSHSSLRLFIAQFKSPITIILFFAAGLSSG